VGGFDRGHREHPRFELEFTRRLSGHQRHDPEGPTLQVDLCHNRILDHASHQARETIPSAFGDRRAEIRSSGDLLRVRGKLSPIDRGWPSGAAGVKPAGIDPAPYGVVRYSEQ
jgi:hypothetical protein